MNVAYYRRGGVSWVALWTKKGPARDHERDIVQYGPYSSFVDKWIFMLINSDTDMSENCGECGIILTSQPYTWTTLISSVCGLLLSSRKGFFFFFWAGVTFNLEKYALLMPQICMVHGANCRKKYYSRNSSHPHVNIPNIYCY